MTFTDVERVARALCAASSGFWRSSEGLTAEAKSAGIDPAMSNNHWLYKARVAMAATREIDAEAMRVAQLGFENAADWLQQRAKEK